MNTKTLILTGSTGLLLCACIPSVNPFYTEKDVAFDPGLLGEWQARDKDDGPQHWTFERGQGDTYALTVTEDKGKTGHFKATLFNLKEHQFLDLIPTDCNFATNQADLVACAMYPGHLLVHVAQREPELKIAFCDFDWLKKQLEENPRALPHHVEDEQIVLTATTKQLQRFVLKHVDGGELFSDYGELVRQTPADAGTSTTSGH